ncbi:MAG: SCO family protein [Chitinophagaceae bacterium]
MVKQRMILFGINVKNISFTNHLGQKVSLYDIKGKIIVLDFFFTRCPTICPQMTKAMKRLQESFKNPKRKKVILLLFNLFL